MTDVRLLGITRHGLNGSASRYRYYQYVPALEAAGLRCSTATLFDDKYLDRLYAGAPRQHFDILRAYARLAAALRRAKDIDVVFIEKEIFPFLPHLVERVLRPRGIPFIVDLDDAVFHRYDLGARATRSLLAGKFPRLLRDAAAVTAGSEYLAAYAARTGARRVVALPTVVDLARYPPSPREAQEGAMTIGWIGAPVTAKYLKLVETPLARACGKTGSRLRLIGAGQGIRLAGVPTEVIPWTLEGEIDAMRPIDVGIMPLPDTPWERGKCALKLIQSMAMSQPVVASPVGANAHVVAHGENGYHAADLDAWFSALMALHDDPALRARMGRVGRARVERDFSLEVTAPRLTQLVKEVADG